jgi:translation initiation factor IF-1
MPNTRGGKGYKKGKTGRVKTRPEKVIESVNVLEGEGFYARVKKRLGGKPAKFEVVLSNGTTSEVIARGKMHKKVWINPGMLVLVNSGNEIVKIIKENDKDAREANDIMSKVENTNSVFSTFFSNNSSDDEDDIDLSNESPNKKNEEEEGEEECEDEDEDEDKDVDEEEEEDEDDDDDEEGEEEDGGESIHNTKNKYPQKKDKRDKKGYDRSKKSGGFNIDDI